MPNLLKVLNMSGFWILSNNDKFIQQKHSETLVKAQDSYDLSILCLGFTAGRFKQVFSCSFRLVNGPSASYYWHQGIYIKMTHLRGNLSSKIK